MNFSKDIFELVGSKQMFQKQHIPATIATTTPKKRINLSIRIFAGIRDLVYIAKKVYGLPYFHIKVDWNEHYYTESAMYLKRNSHAY